MSNAVRSFLGSLVDYAGLFPPASLDVPSAVAEYARHQGESEAWMLGRFIAPAGRLAEIGQAAVAHLEAGGVWPFSVLVGARGDPAEALSVLAGQATAVEDFKAAYPGQVAVECLEIPLPLHETGAMVAFVPQLLAAVRANGLVAPDVFLELPAGGDDNRLLKAIAAAGPNFSNPAGDFARLGAKLRCGGVTADAFPSCARVAGVIHAAAGLSLPLKCTAGLHHPVRHRAVQPDVMMHGFLNVFGAGVLASALQLDLSELTACVAETDPQAFSLTADGFAWRDHLVTAAQVHEIRERSLCGFGSCSFAEPREDLQALGIL